ncbi:MAG: GNAT family N-acetyltransferase, partial [Mesorhizobium sp.]
VRNQGHARHLILSALKWARLRGAREAWLQVEDDNAPALTLYRSLGFDEVYRYHYRRPPGA